MTIVKGVRCPECDKNDFELTGNKMVSWTDAGDMLVQSDARCWNCGHIMGIASVFKRFNSMVCDDGCYKEE